jgi:hypothetical protein
MVDAHMCYLLVRMETVVEAEREVTGELAGGLSRARPRLRAGASRLARALRQRARPSRLPGRGDRSAMDPASEIGLG